MTDFFNSIFTWFGSLNWSEWTLLILALLVIAALVSPDDEEEIDENNVAVPKDNSSEDGEDTITCTVPGQKPIILRPSEFKGFSEEYNGVWSVTLSNGNYILIPMQYTTILDSSMNITTI